MRIGALDLDPPYTQSQVPRRQKNRQPRACLRAAEVGGENAEIPDALSSVPTQNTKSKITL